jgi:hypothetical protein
MAERLQLERFMPAFDVRSAHETVIEADLATTYAALLGSSFADSVVVRFLLRVRSLGKPLPQRKSGELLQALEGAGFLGLHSEAERETVFGIAGKFWLPTAEKVTFSSPDEWERFRKDGYAKAAWNLSLFPIDARRTRLCTQTRVQCFGTAARTKFRLYWTLVGPFSGMTRTALLKQVKRRAEASTQSDTIRTQA